MKGGVGGWVGEGDGGRVRVCKREGVLRIYYGLWPRAKARLPLMRVRVSNFMFCWAANEDANCS